MADVAKQFKEMIDAKDEDGRLRGEVLSTLINTQDRSQYEKNRKYFRVENVAITTDVETNAANNVKPNNYIPLPFARKSVNEVVGYAGKPGKINYLPEPEQDEKSVDALNNIIKVNNLNLTTSEIFQDSLICGQGAELAWFDGAIPRFAQVDREQCIFVYKTDVSGELDYSIRHYQERGFDKSGALVYVGKAEVYWPDRIDTYKEQVVEPETEYDPQQQQQRSKEESTTMQYVFVETKEHGFKMPPLHEYRINSDNFGIFQASIPIIDRLDFSGSDSIANALDKFGDSLLAFSKKVTPEDAEMIKAKRIVDDLGTEGDYVKFIQRVLDMEASLKSFELFERLYYDLTQIPNFDDEKFNTKSGIAMAYALISFENLASQIETYFTTGLQYRLELINNIMETTNTGYQPISASVTWERNLPFDVKNRVEVIKIIRETGLLSDETLLNMFPENLVEDAKAEMAKKVEEEKDAIKTIMDKQDAETGEPRIDVDEEEETPNE